tara:strand:+ start:54 stop:365 length:312 start_codon:yes stop_codon:yes gene_type:complete
MKNLLILYTTISNKYCAEKIARKLIKDKLAACVSIKEINSFYVWDENIQNDNEYEMTIKSKPEKLNSLITFLKVEVGYEIPQILYKNFESEKSYYEWAKQSMN